MTAPSHIRSSARPDVRAILTFHAAEGRGRHAPVASPLYCQIDYEAVPKGHYGKLQFEDWTWDCVWTFDSSQGVAAEEPIEGGGVFARPEAQDGRLAAGNDFVLRQGRRILGRGRVTVIAGLPESAEASRSRYALRSRPVAPRPGLPADDGPTRDRLRELARTAGNDHGPAMAAAQAMVDRGAQGYRTVLRHSRGDGFTFRRYMWSVLAALTADPVEALTMALDDPDQEVRRAAVLWLRDRGDEAARAAEALVSLVRAEPHTLGRDALDAIRAVGAPAVAPLARLVADGAADPAARCLAAEGIGLEEEPVEYVEAMVKVMLDPGDAPVVREAVAHHLWRATTLPREMGTRIRRVAVDADDHTRALAAEALRRLGV